MPGCRRRRIRSVTGHADRDPLLPADPLAAANRRIAIVVLRDGVRACRPALSRRAMLTIGGLVFLLVCVFGSYLALGRQHRRRWSRRCRSRC